MKDELVLTVAAEALQSPSARKVLLAARYAQVPLRITSEPRDDTNKQSVLLTPPVAAASANNWTLTYGPSVRIAGATTGAALKLVARLAPRSANLLGETESEEAATYSWLSYLWSSLGLPLQVALATKSSAASGDLDTALTKLNDHLLYRTYLVGQSVTVADIDLVVSLQQTLEDGLYKDLTKWENLSRWYETMIHQSWFTTASTTAKNTSSVSPFTMNGGLHLHGEPTPVVSQLFRRHRIRIKEILASNGATYLDQIVTVAGWARTVRKASSKLLFVEINDGSSGLSLQCVLDAGDCEGFDGCKTSGGTGASFQFKGKIVSSQGSGQAVEMQVTEAVLLGAVYADNMEGTKIGGAFYPMSKKEHTLEHFRDHAHLRARASVHAAAMRIRHAMAFATHNFFHNHGFLYIHTPIITGADCEGAGEQFGVTSLLGSDHLKPDVQLPVHKPPEEGEKKLSKSELKRQAKKKGKGDPNKPEEEVVIGAVDYSGDFFGQRVNLTVSGQLNVETHACALSDVYTFGPTFRAEYSFTARHLSEFWMIEPEIAFADLTDDINLAEDYLKYCVQFALDNCADDLAFFENSPHGEKGLRDRLRNVLENPFKRLTYTEAIEILQKAVEDGVVFEEKPVWGMDLPSEFERYICEKVFKQPVVLTNYPKDIKAFYMKVNEDGKTVAAADVLVPKIGEIIGGSQREHRFEVLRERCIEMKLDPRQVWWYLDLRRFGTVPHAGFGLGFERLILFVTGLSNIRDVIPFPRWAGNAKF